MGGQGRGPQGGRQAALAVDVDVDVDVDVAAGGAALGAERAPGGAEAEVGAQVGGLEGVGDRTGPAPEPDAAGGGAGLAPAGEGGGEGGESAVVGREGRAEALADEEAPPRVRRHRRELVDWRRNGTDRSRSQSWSESLLLFARKMTKKRRTPTRSILGPICF